MLQSLDRRSQGAGVNVDADRQLQAPYRDKALAALERSHANGNTDYATTRIDADLISIRDDPRFQQVLKLETRKRK